MARHLTDEDIEAICQRLTEFSGLSPEEHKDHHRAFDVWLDNQRLRAEFWEKVKQQIGGWMFITVISGIGYAAWKGFLAVAKGNM
jgi:hypothetical protein